VLLPAPEGAENMITLLSMTICEDSFLIFRKNNYFCKDIVITKRFLNKL
jgi:hypothetical protein